ncbi:hypothetical protein PISMIDRAFT_605107 [Pisolithus microcarpus 441]|uniref:Uncharacterized protein n=1 Tax=Pisolithus microcarpus 441 TaxID=765257 RepID=A0A0D0A7R5_9AGAM|nr:hypothetical protein BKA83DRAFT_605107 [Pisolithus microcarpus]KIK28103.1 hypothetical protein PISMIDRAFT_605107 [Pisolithus microcarpus 441]
MPILIFVMHRRRTPSHRSILLLNLLPMTHSNSPVIVDCAFQRRFIRNSSIITIDIHTKRPSKFPICRRRASSSKKVCWFCSRGTFARGTLSPSPRYHRIFHRTVALTLCSQIPQIFLALTLGLRSQSRHAEP